MHATLETLPNELLYHILRYVDVSTRFTSFRHVCKRFYNLICTDEDCSIDFRGISKLHFQHLNNYIQTSNITQLVLSDDDRTAGQIDLFHSHYDIKRLKQLRSLTLLEILDSKLNLFLDQMQHCPLRSLTIHLAQPSSFTSEQLHSLITNTLAQLSTLRRFDYKLYTLRPVDAPIPTPSPIEHLTLHGYASETVRNILLRLPNLKSLVLRDFIMSRDEDTDLRQRGPWKNPVTSLIIESHFGSAHNIPFFVSLFPLLTYLKLSIENTVKNIWCDGKQWESLIQHSLPRLQNFEFFFKNCLQPPQYNPDLESIINSFRTPFWLDEKRWYMQYEFLKYSHTLNLYSLPMCSPTYHMDIVKNDIMASTHPSYADGPVPVWEEVSQVIIDNFNTFLTASNMDFQRQSNNRVYPNVQQLTVAMRQSYSSSAIDVLGKVIDLSNIVHLTLNLKLTSSAWSGFVRTVSYLLKRTHRLEILEFYSPDRDFLNIEQLEAFCSAIPTGIKHLRIPVNEVRRIEVILNSLNTISSVTFSHLGQARIFHSHLMHWLEKHHRKPSYRSTHDSFSLWLFPCISRYQKDV